MKRGKRGVRQGGGGELTNAAGFLRRPLVVFLTGDVLLAHQLEGGQTLEVESVPVTKTCPLTFAVCRDSGISTAALFNLCVGRINKKTHTQSQDSPDSHQPICESNIRDICNHL